MRLRHTLRIITWSAAGIAAAILIIGKEKDYAWIGIVILAAFFLHFLIETALLLKRGSFRRRLSDLSEYKEHRLFQVKDLEATFAADADLEGISIPVILNGSVAGGVEKKAPLSQKKVLAYRLVAEPLEGMGKVGGQVLLVDSYWSEMSLRDDTGTVRFAGPGVLDGSSFTERIFTLKNLHSELPAVAARVEDGLGIVEGKESKSVRIALREIALLPAEKVRLYGKAARADEAVAVSGTDKLGDPESLLVRAASSPASARIPRRTIQTIVFGFLSLVFLAALGALASRTVIADMLKPGGLFDPTATSAVSVDLDGRPLRVTIGASHWNFTSGDTTKGLALTADDSSFQASRSTPVTVQGVTPETVTVANGDAAYPRWDGTSWLLDAGQAAPSGNQAPGTAASSGTGWLYIRNLTGSATGIRVLSSDGSPVVDTSWTFSAYEAADDPRGHYLELQGKALKVSGSNRLEIITKKGFHRILALSGVARWGQSGSWLFEIVPEYLAGAGKLYVKNSGDSPVRIWILGADGKTLYGDEPWEFEPQEGLSENKGLRLTYDDKDIILTGRESVKLEIQHLTKVYEGTLDRIAARHRGIWTVVLGRLPR